MKDKDYFFPINVPLAIEQSKIPLINFDDMGLYKPKYTSYDSTTLPVVDYVALVWTDAEWAGLKHIFHNSSTTILNDTEQWTPYSYQYEEFINSVVLKGNVDSIPSMASKTWGSFALFELNNSKKLLLFKSNMHPSTDGLINDIKDTKIQKSLNLEINQVPLTVLIEKILKETKAKMIFSTGTSGGTVLDDVIGSVNVSNEVYCSLQEYRGINFALATYKGKITNNTKVSCNWNMQSIPNDDILKPIHGSEQDLQNIVNEINKHFSLLPSLQLSSFMNQAMDFNIRPKFNNYCDQKMVLTTNTYKIADTSGNHSQYAVQEMDDYFVAVVANYMNIPFGLIRNISDPVSNSKIGNLSGELLDNVRTFWSEDIYSKYGFYTSINSAIALLYIVSNQ